MFLPKVFEESTELCLYLQRQVLGIFANGFWTFNGCLMNEVAEVFAEQLTLLCLTEVCYLTCCHILVVIHSLLL